MKLIRTTLLDELTLPYIRDLGARVDVRRFVSRDELFIDFGEKELPNSANRLHLLRHTGGILVEWWHEVDGEEDAECVGQSEARDIDHLRELIEAQAGKVKLRMVFDGAIA